MTDTIASVSRLVGRTLRRDSLSPAQEERMFNLLGTFFDGVARSTFAGDLREKSHVILLEDEAGSIRGFSTLLVYRDRCSRSRCHGRLFR